MTKRKTEDVSKPLTIEQSGVDTLTEREHQRRAAKRILKAVKSDVGVRLSADETYAIWLAFVDYWADLAEEKANA